MGNHSLILARLFGGMGIEGSWETGYFSIRDLSDL